MVSIIIPTMNRAELLAQRALRSAINQNFKDYEIIVIDDAGTDDTKNMMKSYMARHNNIRYHKLAKNGGLSHARNFGIQCARGEYVVCLDDDNELAPDFLKETTSMLQMNPDVHAIYTGRVIQYREFADQVFATLGKFTAIDWGWLMRKWIFNVIQYDEDLRANEDTDFGIRFFKLFRAMGVNKPLQVAHDELGDPKKSLSFPNERELNGMKLFFKKNLQEYDDPKELWCLYRLMGRKFYRGGFRLAGLRYLWLGFKGYRNLRSFLHLFFMCWGWTVYDIFMTLEERAGARMRT